jgi:hypothetical protein
MKVNESNLADPLLLTGCALGGPPWGSGGPFGGQDLISTTTFPDDSLLLPATPNSGVNINSSSLSCKGSSPNGPTGVELDALLIVGSSDSFAELKPLPPFEYAAAGTTVVVGALSLQNDPHLPQMGPASNQPSSNNHNHINSNNSSSNSNNSSRNSNHNPHHLQHHPGGSVNSSNNSNRNNNMLSNSNHPNPHRNGGSSGSTGGNSLVSSPNGTNFSSSVGGSPSSIFDSVSSSTSVPANIKSELADYLLNSDIDDIAALIGNAIADSTVPNLGLELDPNAVSSSTIDPWGDLDAWIESACQQPGGGGRGSGGNGPGGGGGGGGIGPTAAAVLMDQDATIHTSASDQAFLDGSSSTLQTLLESDSYSGGGGNNPMFHQELKHQTDFHPTSILQSRLNHFLFTFSLLLI